jgi:acyl-CoA synthetase (NDP forming)/GNAT superfamily N-acetyltransferase
MMTAPVDHAPSARPDIPDPDWSVDALAADGTIAHLRPARTTDTERLIELYRRGSEENLRQRFFGVPGDYVVEAEVARLVRPPAPDHDVLVAIRDDRIVGVASYERRPVDSTSAEFAVFVEDAYQGQGLGTLLLEHLAGRARRAGVTELAGDVLPTNTGMLRLAHELGTSATFEAGLVDVRLRTMPDDAMLALADARDRGAQAQSLRPLLRPASIAVVGAGRTPGGIGHATLQALVEYGFTGRLFAVNPSATEILGVPAFSSVSAIGEPVDLIVVAVPAARVAEVIADAASAGARAAVVVSSGFGEVAGGASQAEIVALARRHSMRLVGPNCLGVLNTEPAVKMAALFSPVLPPPGGLALASQSGAVGIAVLDHAAQTGVGISTFVSLGNKADVSGNDLLSYWYDDSSTRAVALYLESFGNPRRFARIARTLARRKPVLAVVSGRSSAGARAGASHTAAAASPAVAVDTLCAQAGIIRVDHLGELLDTARVVTDQPLPAGNRLGILGNAGGVNVLSADAASAAGLEVPAASASLAAALSEVAPGGGNPYDLGAGASPAAFASALELMCGCGEFDAMLVVVAATRANDVTTVLGAIAPVADRHPTLPVAVVVLGASRAGESSAVPASLGRRRAPVFDLPERAVAAFARAARYRAWLAQPMGTAPALSDVDGPGARTVVAEALARGAGWQEHATTVDLLRRYGIPVAPTVTVDDVDAAIAAARSVGYPVVLKAADPNLVHKSDIGAVRLNLADDAAVADAYAGIAAALAGSGSASARVIVQPMISNAGQVELVAGIVHDKLFGSLVMLGLGGVHTDLFGDRAFALVPVTDLDAGRMWRSLKAAPLLTGYRGSAPVSTEALEDLVLRLGKLAEDLPAVAELDLNPVLVSPSGVVVVDTKLRLAAVEGEPDAALRQLRPASR